MFGKPNQTNAEEELLMLNENDLIGDGAEADGNDKPVESDGKSYTIKHNGEYIDLPVSDLIVLAQKGMDYDRIRKQRDKMRALVEKNPNGEAVGSDELFNTEESRAEDRHGVENLLARAALLLEKAGVQPDVDTLGSRADTDKARFTELFMKNPELTSLPDEVYVAIAQGLSPAEAYASYEKEHLRKRADALEGELEALKNNEKNRLKALSTLRDDAPSQSPDDFISGLFG